MSEIIFFLTNEDQANEILKDPSSFFYLEIGYRKESWFSTELDILDWNLARTFYLLGLKAVLPLRCKQFV